MVFTDTKNFFSVNSANKKAPDVTSIECQRGGLTHEEQETPYPEPDPGTQQYSWDLMSWLQEEHPLLAMLLALTALAGVAAMLIWAFLHPYG